MGELTLTQEIMLGSGVALALALGIGALVTFGVIETVAVGIGVPMMGLAIYDGIWGI